MMSSRRLVTYLVSLPADLLWGWPAVLLVRLLWGSALWWEGEALATQIRDDSWPARTWYRTWGGTTVSPHAISYGARQVLGRTRAKWVRIQRHEHVHVEQGEVAQLGAAVVAAVLLAAGHPWLALGTWTLAGYALMGGAGLATAWLRGEPAYRGATHEESAYAQAPRETP